ncbi:MAG: ribonucleotide-diphosphate reductase subunit alpha, partial [Deltaproteobacteria bacterium]|nr:ribonucleotide-diphosphate reductase subunit alpha [Deltaproteobacteria bacterium]
PQLGPIEATNPCGEQPLLPFESCNLGSINLAALNSGRGLDCEELGRLVSEAVRFLDDVVTVNSYPLTRIRRVTLSNRKIGLGVMGFADLLIRLGIAYDSQAAVDLAGEIMAFIQTRARQASSRLAKEKGSFPNFDRSILARDWPAMRNATVTTIAPTGSISLIAQVSSGIEPLFALTLSRRILRGNPLVELHPGCSAALKEAGCPPQVARDILVRGQARAVAGTPPELSRLFVTAQEVDWTWHLKIQAAFQEHTDNAVSKTINLAAGAGPEVVSQAVREAHRLGLKGLTLYRNQSRPKQVITPGLGSENCAACRFG